VAAACLPYLAVEQKAASRELGHSGSTGVLQMKEVGMETRRAGLEVAGGHRSLKGRVVRTHLLLATAHMG